MNCKPNPPEHQKRVEELNRKADNFEHEMYLIKMQAIREHNERQPASREKGHFLFALVIGIILYLILNS